MHIFVLGVFLFSFLVCLWFLKEQQLKGTCWACKWALKKVKKSISSSSSPVATIALQLIRVSFHEIALFTIYWDISLKMSTVVDDDFLSTGGAKADAIVRLR